MNTTLTAILVFGCLAGAVLTGRNVRRHLPEDHLSADSKDTVKLEATPARADLRAAVEAGTRQLWAAMANARVQSAPSVGAGDEVFAAVHALNPRDDAHRALKAQAAALVVDLAQLRALLLAQSLPSISLPLLVAVVAWLVLIFLGFSLLAPPNTTTAVALIASALCVSGAIFLILELDRPFGGLVQIPSAPLAHALKELPE